MYNAVRFASASFIHSFKDLYSLSLNIGIYMYCSMLPRLLKSVLRLGIEQRVIMSLDSLRTMSSIRRRSISSLVLRPTEMLSDSARFVYDGLARYNRVIQT